MTQPEALLRPLRDEMGLDTQAWVHVGGTGAGGYFEAADNVLVAVPVPGYVQAEPDARRSLEEFYRIAQERGRAQAVIVLVDRVTSQDASARRVWSDDSHLELRAGLALVCRSPLSRAIGSFFIGLNRPPVPTKMFRAFDEALLWSKDRVEAKHARASVG